MSARPAKPCPLVSPLGLTHGQYLERCRAVGVGSGRASAAYTAFYREGRLVGPAGGTAIAPVVKRHEEDCDEGRIVKFCQRLDAILGETTSVRASDRRPLGVLQDDARVRHLDIETVVIPMIGRTARKTHTMCLSSQVGCAMGCEFCETAQMGLIRSLTAAEIVGQWFAARHQMPDDGPFELDNIVFMGMGEPLDNLDEVLKAIACLTDHLGAAMAMSKITISTVGRVDGLRRLVDVVQRPGWKRLGLALSINAPNDAVRSSIMPVNKRWGMGELREVMEELVRVRGSRKVLFEYVLIPGVNDGPDHARELAEWLRPFTRDETRGHIGLLNVIPYNPRRNSPWPAPDEARVKAFVDELADLGVFVKRRRTKGRSQMAACGQLGAADIRKRKYVPADQA